MHIANPTQRSWYGVLTFSILALAVAAGCGSDSDDTKKTASAGGFDSAYCVTARKWAAHELNGEAEDAYARGGPAAARKYMREYVAYTVASAQQAPPSIRKAAAIKDRAIRTQVAPVLEKYGYDPRRLEAKGTAADKAAVQSPGPTVQKAQEITHAYDDRVCQYGGEPPAAEVRFKRTAAAKPYCKAVADQQKGFEEVLSSLFSPEALRSFSTSRSFRKALNDQAATAPAEIAADVKADTEWDRTRKVEVLEDYDYDLRRLLTEGSQEDLAVFNYWDPKIRKQDSRVSAYQQEVCGV
jgi:hypothetical protein